MPDKLQQSILDLIAKRREAYLKMVAVQERMARERQERESSAKK